MQWHKFDGEYVHRLANGDAEVEEHFSRYFGELLCIKLRRRLRGSDAVNDVKQVTFLRVLSMIRKGGLERPEALGAVVNSVCNNILFEAYRAGTGAAQPVEDRVSEEASAETALMDAEQRDQVRKVMAEMPAKDQAILRRVFFEERDKADVCREFEVDREYLRVLLHRAKLRFRSLFVKKSAELQNITLAKKTANRQ